MNEWMKRRRRFVIQMPRSRAIRIDHVDAEGTEQSVVVSTSKPRKRQTKHNFDAATVRVKLEFWSCIDKEGTVWLTKDKAEAESWKEDDKMRIIPLYKIIEDA